MTLPASIRVNVKASFPAIVQATGFLTLAKANGVWTFGTNFRQMSPLPGSLIGNSAILAVQDPASGSFYSVSVGALATAVAAVSRVVTASVSGVIAMLPTDGDVLVNLASPAAVTVDLLSSLAATRPVCIKDLAGNASTDNITITPFGSETIDGSNSSITIATDGGAITLYPLPNGISGWYQK